MYFFMQGQYIPFLFLTFFLKIEILLDVIEKPLYNDECNKQNNVSDKIPKNIETIKI